MLLVLLAGALVTNTESGEGCGTDWPLCHGKFIPAKTLESAIEYSHRLVSGVVGMLVLFTFVVTYRLYRKHAEAMWYAGGTLFFTVVQALMGAAAVKWPTSEQVMALHFGISLFAFACTLLLVVWAYRNRNGDESLRVPYTVPRSFYPRIWLTWGYSLIVIYLGAYIRHTDSAGGCTGWPLCNGQVIPPLEGATGIAFVHRIAAAILFLAILGMYVHIRRSGRTATGIAQASKWALILTASQVASGALLVATVGNEDLFIFTSLIHNLIICGLFGVLADMSIRSWKMRDRQMLK